jgi:hypothetical protein
MPLTVTASDLETFLGLDAIDTDRADQLIGLAMDLVESIVSPAPDAAKAIVLTAAARAYANPEGLTQELVGPYQASRPAAGIYLTKSERASLRRLAGVGGAFSFDLLGINGAEDATDYPESRFPTT